MILLKLSVQIKLFLKFLLVFLAIFTIFTLISDKKTSQNLQKKSAGLDSSQYELYRKYYSKLVESADPQIALASLRQSIKTDNTLLKYCHPIAHDIGQKSFSKYRDFTQALKYQDEICNSGYLHGVIENFLAQNPNYQTAFKTVCKDFDTESYLGWECNHGIGHGLMFVTTNNLPLSISMCDSLQNEKAAAYCANGVFMENFNTDQKTHPSAFLKSDDPFYPCISFEKYKSDCFTYAPVYYLDLNNHDFQKALSWCDSAPNEFKNSCTFGVGTQAIKEAINEPKQIENMCTNPANKRPEACIIGMITLYVYHFGNIENGKQLCSELEKNNKQICDNLITQLLPMFTKSQGVNY